MYDYSTMIVKHENLLQSDADIIVQQCNCVTVISHGLSGKIAEKYRYADPYSRRKAKSANTAMLDSRGIPGNCEILGQGLGESGPKVACLMAQICPGKPGVWCRQYNVELSEDTSEKRLIYFERALGELSRYCGENAIKTVAFPYKIGCGLAGGSWQQYEALLIKFDESTDTETTICRI